MHTTLNIICGKPKNMAHYQTTLGSDLHAAVSHSSHMLQNKRPMSWSLAMSFLLPLAFSATPHNREQCYRSLTRDILGWEKQRGAGSVQPHSCNFNLLKKNTPRCRLAPINSHSSVRCESHRCFSWIFSVLMFGIASSHPLHIFTNLIVCFQFFEVFVFSSCFIRQVSLRRAQI